MSAPAGSFADRMHANNVAAQQRVAHLNPAAASARIGPWLLFDAATPGMPAFSQAFVVEEAADGPDIKLAERWYTSRDADFRLMLRDDADAPLIEAATATGYQLDYSEPALLLERERGAPPLPEQLTIAEVANEADLERYGALGWRSDGLEHIGVAIARRARDLGFTMLLGCAGAEAVGSSMAVVTDELVGVYNVSVEPPFRRRGFGAAMVWAAVEAGLHRGASAAWLGSRPMSHALYERMGFRRVFEYRSLMRSPG